MRKFWIGFWSVIILSFSVLGYTGLEIYHKAPPIPDKVVSTEGEIIIPSEGIKKGQNVWQAMGGMEVGSIWGHGSYVAPDWTADWLHREAIFILDKYAKEKYSSDYDKLSNEDKASLRAKLEENIRKNTYDSSKDLIVLDSVRAEAYKNNLAYYKELFSKGKAEYAIPKGALTDEKKLEQLSAFIFWSSWAASTNRPDKNITYTSNWPHEPLVGNLPTSDSIVWTGVSIIVLLGGIAGMVWFFASRKEDEHKVYPEKDPLFNSIATPSQKATLKYFWIVSALILVQIGLGIITVHYGVEGNGLYGLPIDKWLPYSVTRTWHTQIGIFWIATAWLAAGLYMAPIISGVEPKGQRLGVNILFGALLVVVVGSLTGEWLSVMNMMPEGDTWFYFGHQGLEYVDLGRVWQIGLLTGLFLWLGLVGRCIVTAIKKNDSNKPLLTLFFISTIAIASFYASGLMWGKHTNLAVTEYWRWWVVHLWVEGFFEIFATSVIALLFVKMGLIRSETANKSVVLSSTIFLSGGIIGTLHHLYFSGTPTMVLALGSVFSALEVVPLVLVGYEAVENLRLSKATSWLSKYKWPIYFFVSVAFWNMVGAGLFGFTINPPIALYYMQGLNTTPLHGHTALFGVYGMLGIGLMLFCLRALWIKKEWNDKVLKLAFWSLNSGLMIMALFSLLPVGLMQTWASVENGYWYARSSEFLYSPLMQTLKWLRVPGDIIFTVGAVALVAFIFYISFKKEDEINKDSNKTKEKSLV